LQEAIVRSWKSFTGKLNLNTLKANGRNRIQYHSGAANVYHCCVHKTASQWIRKILSDPVVHRYSGLKPYHYQSKLYGGRDSRPLKERVFVEPFPTGTIISPLYISFENFEGIPKPEPYKAFFVQRDPRDILVSWYFSVRYSHTLSENIAQQRQALSAMSFDDGILYAMDRLHCSGHFQTLASWIDAPKRNPNAVLVRFEDLIGPARVEVFDALFKHCDIYMPRHVLDRLLTEYSFEALAGRKPGEENKEAHYRKGISGDWKNYLSDALIKRFEELTNNLAARLAQCSSFN
jgi:hypothetical protein